VIHSGITHSLKDGHGTRNYKTRRSEIEAAATQMGVENFGQVSPQELSENQNKISQSLFSRARHQVTENNRVRSFAEITQHGDLARTGQLMNGAHTSISQDYDISEPAIDALVGLLQAHPGVLGAELTGGGFGGAVVFLAKKGQGRAIAEDVMKEYVQHPANGGRFQPVLIEPGRSN